MTAAWLLSVASVSALVLLARARRARAITASTPAAGPSDVLVIGGTGLMGAPTTAKLLEAGHQVVVMSRGRERGQGAEGRRPTMPAGYESLTCDRSDEDAFVRALCEPRCPRVIIDFTAMEPRHVELVLRAHAQRPLAHYVFVSTNMVYAGGIAAMDLSTTARSGERIGEAAARRDGAETAPSNYGGNKLKCEAMLEAAARSGGASALQSTVVRPPAVVGAGCDARHEKLQRAVAGLPPLAERKARPPAEAPGQRFRVACADDVAAVLAAVVDRAPAAPAEAFNVASGDADGITLDGYVGALAVAFNGSADAPAAPDDPAARNFEKQGVLDTSAAERELGFVPTPLDVFMRDTVRWHRKVADGGTPVRVRVDRLCDADRAQWEVCNLGRGLDRKPRPKPPQGALYAAPSRPLGRPQARYAAPQAAHKPAMPRPKPPTSPLCRAPSRP